MTMTKSTMNDKKIVVPTLSAKVTREPAIAIVMNDDKKKNDNSTRRRGGIMNSNTTSLLIPPDSPRQKQRKPSKRQLTTTSRYHPIFILIVLVLLLGIYVMAFMSVSSLDNNKSAVIIHDNKKELLALLYPPGLMGGYRNQVIRFIALIHYAKKHDIDELLLPSLLWSTQVKINNEERWVPIPMKELFDIDYWNSFDLPELVEYDAPGRYDCWETVRVEPGQSDDFFSLPQSSIRGFLTPIANYSKSVAEGTLLVNPRKLDLLPQVETICRVPRVYGGGTGAGRLWNDYMYQHEHDIDALVLKALRPHSKWRNIAESCHHSSDYIALHARIELEMMDHNCGRNMEFNLTNIFNGIETVLHPRNVFVAVSRSGIQTENPKLYKKYKIMADHNLRVLNGAVANNNNIWNFEAFECGEKLLQRYYKSQKKQLFKTTTSIDYGSLLQSMVNFYIATQAKAFVGVRGSSYSTDIWTTRYHQGKGDFNYEYIKGGGIQKMENGGLPPPHKTCSSGGNDKKKKKTKK